MKALLTVFAAVLLTGCVSIHKAVPDDYEGPVARVSDSFDNKEADSAHFYELAKVDGKSIATSWGNTRSANYGRGAEFDPYMVTRKVLPQSQQFTILAYRFYSTDFGSMFGDNYYIEHTFSFVPQENVHYVVKGKVSEPKTQVWLEDMEGNRVPESFLSLTKIDREYADEARKKEKAKKRAEYLAKEKERLGHK